MEKFLSPGKQFFAGDVYRINPETNIHESKTLKELTEGKRSLIFGGPAPFSRLDTEHATMFVARAKDIFSYVNIIYPIYCQDAFVMKQFQLAVDPEHLLTWFGDGDASFTREYQLEHNFMNQGLALRSGRYAMIVDKECLLEQAFYDDYSEINNTSPETILNWLEKNS